MPNRDTATQGREAITTMQGIGERLENWVCFGFNPVREKLTPADREEVIDYARCFEECTHSRDELQAMADADLIEAAFGAMADYARGQM
jgi:hypothetical protein